MTWFSFALSVVSVYYRKNKKIKYAELIVDELAAEGAFTTSVSLATDFIVFNLSTSEIDTMLGMSHFIHSSVEFN